MQVIWRGQRQRLLLILLSCLFLLLLIIIVLLCGLDDGGGDAVQIPLTVLADSAAAVVGLLQNANLLQRLADLPLNGGGRVGVVRRPVAASVAATVQFCEGPNADVFAQVDVPCDSSCGRCAY